MLVGVSFSCRGGWHASQELGGTGKSRRVNGVRPTRAVPHPLGGTILTGWDVTTSRRTGECFFTEMTHLTMLRLSDVRLFRAAWRVRSDKSAGREKIEALKIFRLYFVRQKNPFFRFAQDCGRRRPKTPKNRRRSSSAPATFSLHERHRSKRAAVKALPEPNAHQPLQRCQQRRVAVRGRKPQRERPQHAELRISLLAVPLLAVALALRRETGHRVFTKAELAKYVDIARGLKVAICGQVFDVTKGAEFYAKGAGYGFFAVAGTRPWPLRPATSRRTSRTTSVRRPFSRVASSSELGQISASTDKASALPGAMAWRASGILREVDARLVLDLRGASGS